jgi:hypothetical protein
MSIYNSDKDKVLNRLKYLNKQNFKVENSPQQVSTYFEIPHVGARPEAKDTFFKHKFKIKKMVKNQIPNKSIDNINNNFQYNEEAESNKHCNDNYPIDDDDTDIFNLHPPNLDNLDKNYTYKVPWPQTTQPQSRMFEKNDDDDFSNLKYEIRTQCVQSNSTAFRTNDNTTSTIHLNSLESLSNIHSLITTKESDINIETLNPNKKLKTLINNNMDFPRLNCYNNMKQYFLKFYSKKQFKKCAKQQKQTKHRRHSYNFHDEVNFEALVFLRDIEPAKKEVSENNNIFIAGFLDAPKNECNLRNINNINAENQINDDKESIYSCEYTNQNINNYLHKEDHQSGSYYQTLNPFNDIIRKVTSYAYNSKYQDESIFSNKIQISNNLLEYRNISFDLLSNSSKDHRLNPYLNDKNASDDEVSVIDINFFI